MPWLGPLCCARSDGVTSKAVSASKPGNAQVRTRARGRRDLSASQFTGPPRSTSRRLLRSTRSKPGQRTDGPRLAATRVPRNEAVPGSSPAVGLVRKPRVTWLLPGSDRQDECGRARLCVGGSRGLGDGKSYGSSSRLALGGEGRTPHGKSPAPSRISTETGTSLNEPHRGSFGSAGGGSTNASASRSSGVTPY